MRNFIVFCSLVAIVAIYLSWHFDYNTNPPSVEANVPPNLFAETPPQSNVIQNTLHDDTHDFVVIPAEKITVDVDVKRDIREDKESGNFLADIGVVYPLTVRGKNYSIDNFNKQPPEVQQEVAFLLNNEWGNDELTYTRDYIQQHWASTDIMYVMVSNGDLIGCVAIDRHKFYPFISHLYIKKEHRGLGYAGKMLELCEAYARMQLKFTEIKLWCDQKLVTFYQKQGWTVESVDDKNVFVMSKRM